MPILLNLTYKCAFRKSSNLNKNELKAANAEAKTQHMLSLYLPARSAFILCPTIDDQPLT